jgi:Tfp pilus assembly protein FimT
MSSPFHRSSGSITRRRPQAFTLVELLVIVAVIGIVSGVAITGMATFLQEQKLRQATAELASYLQSARARAQREGGFCQLAVSGTQIAPTTLTGNVCNNPNNPPVQPGLDLAAVSAASGLAVTASSSTPITFTRLGTLVGTPATATMPRMITLSANRTTMQTCVFLDLVGIRTGWRLGASGTCTYTNG